MSKKLERLTDKHMRLLAAKMQGYSFADIGKMYAMTASGARVQIRFASSLLRRKGADALPVQYKQTHSIEEILTLISSVHADPDLPVEPEMEYTIAITKQLMGFVKVRATKGADAKRIAEALYREGESLPDMEDLGELRFSIVDAQEIGK